MQGLYGKRILAVLAVMALLVGLLTTVWTLVGAAGSAQDIIVFDADTQKSVDEMKSTSIQVSVKNIADLGTNDGDDAGAPASGTAYHAHVAASRNGVAKENLNLSVPQGTAALDAWIWIEDISKVGTFVVRVYDDNMTQRNQTTTSLIEGSRWQWNSAQDMDDAQDGAQKLHAGWNHIRKNVALSGGVKVINAISIHEHTETGANNYAFAIGSLTVTPTGAAAVDVVSPAAEKDEADLRTIGSTYMVKNAADFAENAPEGAPTTGTAYYAELITSRTGMAWEDLNLDVSKVNDKKRTDGSDYLVDAWIWISDASKINNFVIRFYPDNLKPAANRSLIEYWSWQWNSAGMKDIDDTQDGEQTLQTGWNHFVKNVKNLDWSQNGTGSPEVSPTTINAIEMHDHANNTPGSTRKFNFAVASLSLLKVGGDDDSSDSSGGENEDYDQNDDREYPLTQLTEPCDILSSRYFYEVYKGTAPVSKAAVLGEGQDGGEKGAVWFKDVPLRTGWVARFGTNAGTVRFSASPVSVLTFWVYVSDISKINSACFELGSSATPDTAEKEWNFTEQIKGNGWNKITLDFNSGFGSLNIDKIVRYRIFFLGAETGGSVDFAIDSIEMTHTGPVDETLGAKDDSDYNRIASEINYDFDALDEDAYSYQKGKEVDTDEKKQGDASIKWTSENKAPNGVIALIQTKEDTLDFAISDTTLSIGMWVYVSDIGKVKQFAFELASTGMDADEYQWELAPQLLVNGWNYVTVDLDGTHGTIGEFNWNSIKYWRTFMLGNGDGREVIVRIDDLSLVETKIKGTTLDGFGFDFEEMNDTDYEFGATVPALDTDAKEGEHSYKYTSANTAENGLAAMIRAKTELGFKIEHPDLTYVQFWTYVNDPALLSSAVFELASAGQGADAIQWTFNDRLIKGWNLVTLPLSKGTVPETNPDGSDNAWDPADVNFWSVSFLADGSSVPVEIKLDDVKLVQTDGDLNDNPAKQFDDDCEKINEEKYTYQPSVELDTDAKQGAHSYKFVSPNTDGKTVMRWFTKDGMLNFAIENWRSTYVSFWLYVNDPALITRAAFELSSIAVDAADEFEYEFTNQIVSKGWNEIVVPMMAFDPDELDLEHIRFTRIYVLGDGSSTETVIKLDDVRMIDSSKLPNESDPSDPDDSSDPDDPSRPGDGSQPEDEESIPDTGDAGLPMLAGAAVLLSGAALVVVRRRKTGRG